MNRTSCLAASNLACAKSGASGAGPFWPPRRQRGGALFVALSLLIVVSLLGLAAARVTALQERMAGVYLADLSAFQIAEQRIRNKEREIVAELITKGCQTEILDEASREPWREVMRWRRGEVNEPSTVVDGVEVTSKVPSKPDVPVCTFYITALEFSDDTRTTQSIVQSAFIP